MTERERLIELIETGSRLAYDKSLEEVRRIVKENHHFNSATDRTVSISEIVADFLLENGVIVPPCCIGDTVYEIRENGKNPISGKRFDRCITTVQMLDCAAIRKSTLYAKEKRYAKNDSVRLGKTVFLTREEAENALEEREDNA